MAGRTIFDSVIEYGSSAIRSAILLNGGGAVALLAFVGHLYTSEQAALLNLASQTSLPVIAMGIGAFLGGCAAACAYIAQHEYARSEYANIPNAFSNASKSISSAEPAAVVFHLRGVLFHRIGVFLVILSLFTFVLAIIGAGFLTWNFSPARSVSFPMHWGPS
ncbi:hypothetical protein T8K17_13500 [Thalassobaculum sp. OXR-137]|uniref:hypothetical protein n=1 Tax=Thalassobaculum sp. OXR-137 TaxID=3100173 RepID=UPI002AC9893D|nr:hypothetical protein [Thalassobaculum sp. OXR-137]WPZ32257.1 hypothetical protein T8K17_13500 [Thalassobaculum sp. OXR-137]